MAVTKKNNKNKKDDQNSDKNQPPCARDRGNYDKKVANKRCKNQRHIIIYKFDRNNRKILTKIRWFGLTKIFVKFSSMRFLKACTKTKIR